MSDHLRNTDCHADITCSETQTNVTGLRHLVYVLYDSQAVYRYPALLMQVS